MHSRKNIILLWVMLLGAAFVIAGCKKDTGEESVLVSVEETDIELKAEEKSEDNMKEDEESSGDNSREKVTTAGVSDACGANVIYVDVCGQVKNPGVYQLVGESRVYEAIEKAGGMTEDASAASVNQAEKLTDGQQIYVPSKDEQCDTKTENGMAGSAESGKVNLNTASKEELMTLSGIGGVKADAIIRYREEHGAFQSAEDIKKIEGIKDGVFNKIKDQITV